MRAFKLIALVLFLVSCSASKKTISASSSSSDSAAVHKKDSAAVRTETGTTAKKTDSSRHEKVTVVVAPKPVQPKLAKDSAADKLPNEPGIYIVWVDGRKIESTQPITGVQVETGQSGSSEESTSTNKKDSTSINAADSTHNKQITSTTTTTTIKMPWYKSWKWWLLILLIVGGIGIYLKCRK